MASDSKHHKPFLARIAIEPPDVSLLEARAAENEAHAHARADASVARASGLSDGFYSTRGAPTRAPPLIPRKPVPLRSARHRDGSYFQVSVARAQTIEQIAVPPLEEEVEDRARAQAHAHADTLPGARDSIHEILRAESPTRTPAGGAAAQEVCGREIREASTASTSQERSGKVHHKTVRFPGERSADDDDDDDGYASSRPGLHVIAVPVSTGQRDGVTRGESSRESDRKRREAAVHAPAVSRAARAGERRSLLGSLSSAALAAVVGVVFLVLQGTWFFWFGLPARVFLYLADRLGLPRIRRAVVRSWLPDILLRRARHRLWGEEEEEEEKEEKEEERRVLGGVGLHGLLVGARQLARGVEFVILKGLLLSALRVAEILCDWMTARERARAGAGARGPAEAGPISEQVERRFLTVHARSGSIPVRVCGTGHH